MYMDALPICMSTNHMHVQFHGGQRVLDILKVELPIIVSEMLSRFWEPNPGSLKDQTEILNAEQSL